MKNYELLEEKRLPEIDSEACVYRHKRSGAQVFTMKNADENRVFSIAFRTPAEDSTGVAHIMEHSALCGSERFPLKDPFVELAKGSLNTFLNAMTYPDKTVYPVASTNEKDFENLMNVYMDAVLHPNCLRDERIFRQEGWHYELENAASELRINGVVYNEMKGAFSSPESVLERYILHSLFPDTSYGNESGGDPEVIPELSYAQFCAFHARYYHPSNSYIVLYGDLDMEERLEWLDREYLSQYTAIAPASELRRQTAFSKPIREEIRYSVGEKEPVRKSTYLSYNIVIGDNLDAKRNMAFSVLDYALLSAPGAPLKQALLEAGIGEDIFGGFEDGILQPYFSITAKNAAKKDEKRFVQLITEKLRALSEQGLDRKTLLAAINHDEFRCREADYGRTPKGLIYGLTALDSWIYGGKPWLHIETEQFYAVLREAAEQGYFEALIREYLLGNPHSSLVVVSPERGLHEKREQALREQLAERKAALSEQALRQLIDDTGALRRYQEEGNSEAALRTLPILSREDIDPKAAEYRYTVSRASGIPLLSSELPSRGILYLRLNFNTAALTEEELPYAALLKTVLGYMDTGKHSLQALSSEILLHTGGISFDMTAYPDLRSYEHYTGVFSVDLKLLREEIGTGLSLAQEILHQTRYASEKRMMEILNESRSRERMRAQESSHTYAVNRATSGFSGTARYQELCGGIAYLWFVEEIAASYRRAPEKLTAKLREVSAKLFRMENLFLSAGGEKSCRMRLDTLLPEWKRAFEESYDSMVSGMGWRREAAPAGAQLLLSGSRREGFGMSSQVNYVARTGRFDTEKLPYTGALRVLKGILNYEYLWKNLREKGGAYGCMAGFGRSGEGYLVSYRDPKLRETLEVYERLPDYIRSFTATDRTMMKYIIGAISELDTPRTNHTKSLLNLSAYLSGVTEELLQREREELLHCTAADIRALAPYVEAILAEGASCTIGGSAAVRDAGRAFDSVEALFG
ncbi:MAG: insulinase family protein [Oribacterium sp.]